MKNNRKSLFAISAATAGLVLALCSCGHVAFTHAPPGESVKVVQAKKAIVVPTPTPVPKIAAVSPEMPSNDSTTQSVADYYTLGNLMMQQEKYAEAIKAYESAVKLDPTFYDAWNHLAICYQNTGQDKKAIEAFKKYKTITGQQPATTGNQ